MKNRLLIILISFVMLSAFFPHHSGVAQAQVAAGTDGKMPDCSEITGTAAVTYTRDEGKNITPTVEQLRGISYTYGLVTLDRPETLLATNSGKVLVSEDAGCNWRVLDAVNSEVLNLNAASGGFAYGWETNSFVLLKIELTGITKLSSPVGTIIGLAVDRNNGQHLRLGGGDGSIWDSIDAGANWTSVGRFPTTDSNGSQLILYKTTFDESNLDHILVGTTLQGAFFSKNGGKSWKRSKGFAGNNVKVNIFNIVISPVDGKVVWAMGLNLAESDGNAPSRGRHIYRSINGGKSFKVVVDASIDVTLTNGPLMVPHPTNANILYFEFGTFFNNFGTDLYKYDFGERIVTKTHNDYDGIASIAFSPTDPSIMYLGLLRERDISE